MKVIYKYPLVAEATPIQVGLDDRVRLVACQNARDTPTLWIEHMSTDRSRTAIFYLVGTGHPHSWDAEHIGSAICGPFVWHVYSDIESVVA